VPKTSQIAAADVSAATQTHTIQHPISRTAVVAGFAVLALSFMINAMDRQVFFPILPNIRAEYGFSLPQGGLLATGFTLGMALAGLPAGYLMDRLSRKTVLLASIILYSLGTLATPLAAGFGDMSVYRIVSGFGEGMQSTALYAALGAYFYHRRALAIGGIAMAFGAGVILGPLVGVGFANAYGSWRAPFVLFGGCGLVAAVLVTVVASRGLTDRVGDQAAVGGTFDHMPTSPYNRNTMAMAVSSAVGGMVFYGFVSLYPTYLITVHHYSSGDAALATSCVGFGVVTALLGGWLGDRIDQRMLLTITFVALSGTSLLVYRGPATTGWQCLFAFLMGAFGSGFLFPNSSSAMQRAVRPHQVGSASGLFVSSYYVAAAFSGLLFATLVDLFGWRQAGLLQLTLLPLVAVVALRFVRTSQLNTVRGPTTKTPR